MQKTPELKGKPSSGLATPLASSAVYRPVWLLLLVLALAAALLGWTTANRHADFRSNQQMLMQAAGKATANEISLRISSLRRSVSNFALDRRATIMALLADPDNERLYNQIARDLDRHFPTRFAFSVADAVGAIALDDFDGQVGDICRRDVRSFSVNGHHDTVFIHPNADGYHFDLPVQVNPDGPSDAVFLVSFGLADVARLLGNGELPGHRLLLVKAEDPALIEVTRIGARDRLGEHIRLSEAELARIGFRTPVPGTQWTLVDIPDVGLFSGHRQSVVRSAALVFLAVAVPALLLTLAMLRVERKRRMAEFELVDRNRSLAQALETQSGLRDQLVESEKLASLGSLVAGVAHEINTPVGTGLTAVSVIRETLETLRQRTAAGELRRTDLDAYEKAADEAAGIVQANLERAAEIIRRFKMVSVDRASEAPRQFELCAYLQEVLLSLAPRLKSQPHQVNIQCAGPIEVHSIPGAFAQILTNLVLNSLEHGFREGQIGEVLITVSANSDTVRLVYVDDGTGIAPGDEERVFEPFYTTARASGGSGLGLSVVYNLVTHTLKGHIRLCGPDEHAPGVRFQLSVPRYYAVAKEPQQDS